VDITSVKPVQDYDLNHLNLILLCFGSDSALW